jgi:translation initiation factor 2B subunit (eIF-2B alpha/beta/delta family)
VKGSDLVEEIRKDKESGATALAERALEALARSKSAAPALLKVRPGMPLIANVVRLAQKKGVAAARRALKGSLDQILDRTKDILPPGGRYVTFGSSGTVEAVLRAVGAREPGKDQRPDVALVGADALLPGCDFVNAKGTADFLRRAREQRAGVFVIATELKRVKKAPPLEAGFELVPGRLVHGVLTEKGLEYPPMGTLAGVEPTWLDRGALNPLGGRGICHPHHGR